MIIQHKIILQVFYYLQSFFKQKYKIFTDSNSSFDTFVKNESKLQFFLVSLWFFWEKQNKSFFLQQCVMETFNI